MSILEEISHETMVFMRGNYRLDEIGGGKDGFKFKQGSKTILTIYSYEDRFTFLIIFGKKERESFEMQKRGYSRYILDYYEKSRTYHDGKWMFIEVTTLEQLEEVKRLIQIKKKPNRKPFAKEDAVFSLCGQRCDLCIHYTGMNEELRASIEPHLNKMWESNDWDMRCEGCYSKDDPCYAKECVSKKDISECRECREYSCIKGTAADYRSMIHKETHSADEITWAILPYVPWQYEK